MTLAREGEASEVWILWKKPKKILYFAWQAFQSPFKAKTRPSSNEKIREARNEFDAAVFDKFNV